MGADAAADEDDDDLDEFTKAAILSLRCRINTKNQDQSLRRKGLPVLKRPAAEPDAPASLEALRAVPLKKPKAEPAPVVEVAKSQIMKAMPTKKQADGSNPEPVCYNGGVIYCSWAKRKFRALTTRGNDHTEKGKGWGGDKPCKVAWKHCVDAIDAARTRD